MARNKYKSNGFGNVWAILNGRAGAIRSGSIPTDVEFTVRQTGRGTKAEIQSIRGNTVLDGGTLLKFTGTGIKSVGFNQWDEEWEKGTYKSEDGTKSSNASRIRNKNPIRVISGETYYIKASTTVTAFYYRADGTYINYRSISKNTTFIVSEGAAFMNWATGSSSDPVTTYNHDICINISGYRNGEYEPYWSETRNFPVAQYFQTGMKSAGSVYDELTPDKSVTRIGSRAYAEGDEDDTTVITDGTTTLYPLETPVETPISPPLNLSYRIEKGGTETLLPENGSVPATSPFVGTIDYQIDYTGIVNVLTLLKRPEMRDEDFLTIGLALIESRARAAEADQANRLSMMMASPRSAMNLDDLISDLRELIEESEEEGAAEE